MSVTITQIGIRHYRVNGEVVSRLSTAISIAKAAAAELTELTGIPHTIEHNVYC